MLSTIPTIYASVLRILNVNRIIIRSINRLEDSPTICGALLLTRSINGISFDAFLFNAHVCSPSLRSCNGVMCVDSRGDMRIAPKLLVDVTTAISSISLVSAPVSLKATVPLKKKSSKKQHTSLRLSPRPSKQCYSCVLVIDTCARSAKSMRCFATRITHRLCATTLSVRSLLFTCFFADAFDAKKSPIRR